MKNCIQKALLCLLLVSLTACGLIRDRSGEYAAALPGKALSIPEGYSDLKVGSRYPIPEVEAKKTLEQGSYELPKPPSATAALSKAPYLVETLEELNWLRLYSPPGKIWPLLDFYWQENGVELDRQQIQNGVVLTKAIPDSSPVAKLLNTNTLKPAAIHAKLVQGVRRNTSELHLRVVDPAHDLSESSWQAAKTQQALELALLKDIGQFVTSEASRNRHSLLANDISGEPRVFMKEDAQGQNYLQIKLSFLRAWNEVGKALKASDVVVADIDQSSRKYYVSYLDSEALESWFISDARKTEKAMERNFEVSVEPASSEQGEVFEVRVKAINSELDADSVNELLSVIFEHIS